MIASGFKLLFFLTLSSTATLWAQEKLPDFEGWVSDDCYIEEEAGKQYKVQAKTGKKEEYSPPVSIGKKNNRFDIGSLQLEGNIQNPQYSPDNQQLAFTCRHNLYVADTKTSELKQLTFDGADLIYNGWASWVYYEEILGRSSKYKAFKWSPNNQKIAYMRFDDTHLPCYTLVASDSLYGRQEVLHYPKAGDVLPGVRIGIADVESGKTSWIDLPEKGALYGHFFWSPKGDKLLIQQLNRDQNKLKLFAVDAQTAKVAEIYTDSCNSWIDFFENIYFLEKDKGFIFCSNKDGWKNLYWYGWDGQLRKKLTNNKWNVLSVERIDEKENMVYFMGAGKNGYDQYFYKVNLKGKKTEQMQLTLEPGVHWVFLSEKGSYFIDFFSNLSTPMQACLRTTDAQTVRKLGARKPNPSQNAPLAKLFSVPTTDGFELPVQLVFPANFDSTRRYPVVFSIYGGPDYALLKNSYQEYDYDPIVQEGIIRVMTEHRGSGYFGKKGLDYLYRHLGKWEIHDYVEVAKWLQKKPFVDAGRIGIKGTSYGGYLAAMALMMAPDYFCCGISNAGVSDWRFYDNIYTERYMDKPSDNPEGYDMSSVLTHVNNYKGRLLITHGTMDDNVHPQNSLRLINALQRELKQFDFMLYPSARHGWNGMQRMHSEQMEAAFWKRYLLEK